ncbi:MAG TPA: carboxypeptidase regulatory-like domain-containing protein [Planctomycetota bacterium]|nr:carboxypeptidase regulatory-like domain-containing protein [Planctomycetota bacterium]
MDLEPGSLDLEIKAEGFVPEVVVILEVTKGEILRGTEVGLRPGATVRGAVVERGTSIPVADATVWVVGERGFPFASHLFGPDRISTDSGGAFQFSGLEPRTLRFRVAHGSFADALSDPIETRGGGAVEGVLISLSLGGALDGFAIREGKPLLPTTRVQVLPAGDEMWAEPRTVQTDETGYFKIERLRPGQYSVIAYSTVRAGEAIESGAARDGLLSALAFVEEGGTTRVEFPGPPKGGCTLRGRVLRGGKPVGAATVLVFPDRPPADAADPDRGSPSATTLADGSFTIEHVPPGGALLNVRAHLRGEAMGSALVERRIEVPDRPEYVLDVVLAGGAISGRVVRASDGTPAQVIGVAIVPSTITARANSLGSSIVWASTDEEGRYRVLDLSPGPYWVGAGLAWGGEVAEEDGAVASESRGPIEVVDGGESVVDFALASGGIAVVRVSDPDGRPVEEAGVFVVPASYSTGVRRVLAGGMGETDGEGVARIVGLPPGRYYATVSETEFAGAESDEADVQREAETPFRIALRKGTRVRVRTLDSTGGAIDLLPLLIDSRGRERFASPPPWRTTSWPAETGMTIAVLLPGQYTLRIGGDGWKEQTTVVQVGTESPQDLVLRLERERKPR